MWKNFSSNKKGLLTILHNVVWCRLMSATFELNTNIFELVLNLIFLEYKGLSTLFTLKDK